MASPQKGTERQVMLDTTREILARANFAVFLGKTAESPSLQNSANLTITFSADELKCFDQLRTHHDEVKKIIASIDAKTLQLANLTKAQLASLTNFNKEFQEIIDLTERKFADVAQAPTPLAADGSTQVPPLSPALSPSQVGTAVASVTAAPADGGAVVASAAVDGASANVTVRKADVTPPPASEQDAAASGPANAPRAPSAPSAQPRGRVAASTSSSSASSTSDDGDAPNPAGIATAGATATVTAQKVAIQGRKLVQEGLAHLSEATNQDAHRQAAENAGLAAIGDAAIAADDKDAHVAAARAAASSAESYKRVEAALHELAERDARDAEADKRAAAAADRKLKKAQQDAEKAKRDAAVHAQVGATLATGGRTEVAQGLSLVNDAAEKELLASARLAAQSQQAATAAARLQREANAVAAQTGISPSTVSAVVPPTSSRGVVSPGIDVVSPDTLSTTGGPALNATTTVENKDEPKDADAKDAKLTAPCKKHPAKKTLNKKVIGTVIGLAAATVTAGALLFAPQYVIYVGSVALAMLGIHATILAAKITGSLLITAATAATLTGIVAAVNAVMNYLHAGTKVKAVVKGAKGEDVTATAETTDAAGHTVKATATADASAAPTSTKGFVGHVREALGFVGRKATATATTAPAAAPTSADDEPTTTEQARHSSVSGRAGS